MTVNRLISMKKFFIIAGIAMFSASLSGQELSDHLMRSRAMINDGKPDLAVKELNKAIELNNDSHLYLLRAEANIERGDYSDALRDYNEANKITPNSGEYGIARIYALKGDAQTSLYHLEMNLRSTARKSEKEIMLDPAFGSIEKTPEWRLFWKKEWYTDIEKKISELEYYTSAGKLEESRFVLDEIRKVYPDTDELLYSEALMSVASGKPADGVRAISGLTESYPENEKYLRLLAKAQIAASNYAGASITYSRLLDSEAADADLLLSRADCFRRTGENQKALNDIQNYLDYYPESKKALSMAGKTEALSGDNLKALEFFSTNLELHPNDADCYIDRGNSYLVSKSWAWAIKDYSMSLDLTPGNNEAWLNKGIALLNSGHLQDACHDFRKSLSLGDKRASEYISKNCIR